MVFTPSVVPNKNPSPLGRSIGPGPYGPGVFGTGGGTPTVRSAAEGARYALDKLGIPTLSSLFGNGTSGGFKAFPYNDPTLTAPERMQADRTGLKESNAQLGGAKKQLAFARGEVSRFRDEYNDPTKTGAFRDTLGVAASRTARDVEEQGIAAREAATRSGIVGGYDPARDSRARSKALAETAFEAAGTAREQALKGYESASGLYGSAAGLYGKALDSQTSRANSVREAQTALDRAFGDQTQDYNRNLIEKSRLGIDAIKSTLDAYGGAFNPGSFFETALSGTRFDVDRADRLRAENANKPSYGMVSRSDRAYPRVSFA